MADRYHEKRTFVDIILRSPLIKSSGHSIPESTTPRSLIIHVSEIESLFLPQLRARIQSDIELPSPSLPPPPPRPSASLFLGDTAMAIERIRESVNNHQNTSRIAIIGTSSVADSEYDYDIGSHLLGGAGVPVLMSCPGLGSKSSKLVLDQDTFHYYQGHNNRKLKRILRQEIDSDIPAIQPYADWEFLRNFGEEMKYNKRILSNAEISNLVGYLDGTLNSKTIRKAIMKNFEYEKIIQLHDSADNSPKKNGFSPKIQSIMDTINSREGEEFMWEKQFLDRVVKAGKYIHIDASTTY